MNFRLLIVLLLFFSGCAKSKPFLGIKPLSNRSVSVTAEDEYLRGVRYHRGRGATHDYSRAANHYRRAAEQGHSKAQLALGYLYAEGRGVRLNDAEAIKWFYRSARKGNAVAQYNLALFLYEGRGGPRDYDQALVWAERAMHNGSRKARVIYQKAAAGINSRTVAKPLRKYRSRIKTRTITSRRSRQVKKPTFLPKLSSNSKIQIKELYFQPNPIRAGEKGAMIAVYSRPETAVDVPESWTLIEQEKALIQPIERVFQVTKESLVSSIPYTIPTGAFPGRYKINLTVIANGQKLKRQAEFSVKESIK